MMKRAHNDPRGFHYRGKQTFKFTACIHNRTAGQLFIFRELAADVLWQDGLREDELAAIGRALHEFAKVQK